MITEEDIKVGNILEFSPSKTFARNERCFYQIQSIRKIDENKFNLKLCQTIKSSHIDSVPFTHTLTRKEMGFWQLVKAYDNELRDPEFEKMFI